MDIKWWLKLLGVVVVILIVATTLDYFAHSTSPRFGVPPEYFRNKVIFGSLIGLASLWIFRSKRNMVVGALSYAAIVAVESGYLLGGVRLPLPSGGVAIAISLTVRFIILLAGVLALGILMNWIAEHFKKPTKMAIFFSFAIALGLQTKYFFLGFDLFFVFLFMFLHFAMFLLPAVILFKKYPEVVE